mgnify:CR=1 FL=1
MSSDAPIRSSEDLHRVPEPEPLPHGKRFATKAKTDVPSVVDLLGLDLQGLEDLLVDMGEKKFRAKQLQQWLHDKRVASVDDMSNLSKALRDKLKQQAALLHPTIEDVQQSVDGTRKYQLKTFDGHVIEAVYLPNVSGEGKHALCISSQVGCALGCTFCATASLKLTRHLLPGEIVGQLYTVMRDLEAEGLAPTSDVGKAKRSVTRLVYMGMGEPLHNYEGVVASIRQFTGEHGVGLAPHRITVSTSGMVPAIARLGVDTTVQIAISLNGSHDEGRAEVMPVNKRWNLDALLGALKAFPLKARRRITFEYVLLEGVNDSDDDARRVVRLLEPFRCRLNLIPYNAHPLSPFKRPSEERVHAFQRIVKAGGLDAFIRTTRGDDIDAACGMLGAKKLEAARQEQRGLPVVE